MGLGEVRHWSKCHSRNPSATAGEDISNTASAAACCPFAVTALKQCLGEGTGLQIQSDIDDGRSGRDSRLGEAPALPVLGGGLVDFKHPHAWGMRGRHRPEALVFPPPRRARRGGAGRGQSRGVCDPPAVFEDPLATAIIGGPAASDLAASGERERNPHARAFRAFIVARSRYAEDQLARAVERGVAQYVVPGAGLDTFAYRSPTPDRSARGPLDGWLPGGRGGADRGLLTRSGLYIREATMAPSFFS